MSKDPFQILADEITLIRGEVERLQRTSLDKDEAKALHKIVAKSVVDIQKTVPGIQQGVENQLREAMHTVGHRATSAAHDAAERAVVQSHAASIEAAQRMLDDAGTARREAWRYFGGFWVWLASVGALGAVIGALGLFAIQGRADAKEFGRYPGVFCGSAGGRRFEDTDGSVYCAVLISGPDK